MSEFRSEMGQAARDTRWVFFRFLPIGVIIILVLAVIGFGTRSLGLWGGTVIERKVFENSYQRSESLKSSIATDEATLAEIRQQLSNPTLDAGTRASLEAQAAAARVRIATAKSKQQ